jgi:hypothetical protein
MEKIKSLSDFYVLHEKDVTFYDSSKKPLWSGYVTNCLGSRPDDYHYVWAERVQSFNKDGSKRKNSNGAGKKNHEQIFNIGYYSYGLTPEGVTPQPEVTEQVLTQVLTQAEVDAKLKEYVTERITQLTYYKNWTLKSGRIDANFQADWHIAEAFITIFRELTE